MVSATGDLKLIDFGIARYLDGHEPPPVGERIAGTIGYMSPEQARGLAGEARADQFGLGILLWELLTGRRLFQGNSADTWRRMREGEIPEESLRHVPEDLRRTVLRLLRADPDQRFPHMGEALAELGAATSSPLSGKRPLAALVQHLMADPGFDPFDVRRPAEPQALPPDIPDGSLTAAEYDDLRIEVEKGVGSPLAAVRSVVAGAQEPPVSPFLEPGELESEEVEAEAATAR
jgi:serine/threonine protein kinase